MTLASAPLTVARPLGPARVLIVDDDPSICFTLSKQLSPLGVVVETETDPIRALEAARQRPPDVMLLDYMMPGTDGLSVLRQLRADPACARMPIVMVTALGDRDSAVQALSAGASDYLVKPVHGHELRVRVDHMLQLAAHQRLVGEQRAAAVAELERMKDELLKVDRLASLGTFAAGVGHELNNIITVLASFTNLIALDAAQGKPAEQEHLDGLRAACRHVAHHARAVLDLGAMRAQELERLDLVAVATHVVAMLKVAGRTKRPIAIDAPAMPAWCRWSRTAAEQVLINLVVNAVDAVEGRPGARVTVRIRCPTPTEIVCSVIDEGHGMAPAVLARATESFFTTKPPGKGTGLGLPVVKRLIEAAGGTFAISSVEGQGTEVTWCLPAEPS